MECGENIESNFMILIDDAKQRPNGSCHRNGCHLFLMHRTQSVCTMANVIDRTQSNINSNANAGRLHADESPKFQSISSCSIDATDAKMLFIHFINLTAVELASWAVATGQEYLAL